MINGCKVRVDFAGEPSATLERISGELEKLGYSEKKRDASELKMAFKGKWFTADPAKMKHTLTVTPEADALSFAFSTGLIASTWSDEDREWARSRAQGVVEAIRSGG